MLLAGWPLAAQSGQQASGVLAPFEPAASAPERTSPQFLPEDADLAPVDFGPPVAMPPAPALDGTLLEPLPPLASFDPVLQPSAMPAGGAEAGVRYKLVLSGLDSIGLEQDFRRLSVLVRHQGKPASPAQLSSRANLDLAFAERLLRSEGWYSGSVETAIGFQDDGRAEVALRVEAGERYRWRQITLDLIPPEKPGLGDGFGLRVGDPVRAVAVEEAEGALLLKLLEAGYPFAEIGARDVVLDKGSPTATYFLTGTTGPEGVFGPVRMAGFQPFAETHANVIARFSAGDPFRESLLDDYRRALIATQQFGGVTVSTRDTGARDPQGRAITEVLVQGNEGPRHRLSGQIGYATDQGFRAEAFWRHRSLIQPEGDFSVRGVLGTEEQRATAQLTMGNFRQRDRTLQFAADLANQTRPGFSATSFSLAATIGRASTPIWQKPWTWSAGVLLLLSDERELAEPQPGDPPSNGTGKFLTAAVPLFVGRDNSDDLLDPGRGWRAGVQIVPEISRKDGQVETYVRGVLDLSAYRSIGADFVLAGRTRLGSIVGAERDNIQPTRRFYAGGGSSVRGYDYLGIGEEGANDRPLGGRSLFEASIEGRYRFGDFGAVAFVDAGSVNASPVPGFDGMRYGIGIGGRYFTSFGPIRIDVARGLNRLPADPPFTLSISIGQAF